MVPKNISRVGIERRLKLASTLNAVLKKRGVDPSPLAVPMRARHNVTNTNGVKQLLRDKIRPNLHILVPIQARNVYLQDGRDRIRKRLPQKTALSSL